MLLGLFGVQGAMGGCLFDFCLIGFALGSPLKGNEARKQLAGK